MNRGIRAAALRVRSASRSVLRSAPRPFSVRAETRHCVAEKPIAFPPVPSCHPLFSKSLKKLPLARRASVRASRRAPSRRRRGELPSLLIKEIALRVITRKYRAPGGGGEEAGKSRAMLGRRFTNGYLRTRANFPPADGPPSGRETRWPAGLPAPDKLLRGFIRCSPHSSGQSLNRTGNLNALEPRRTCVHLSGLCAISETGTWPAAAVRRPDTPSAGS